MKLCFFIAQVYARAGGGHARSLETTAAALSAKHDCFVVVVGPYPSPIFAASGLRTHHVHFTGWNLAAALYRAYRIVSEERPDVLHLFDARIDLFARALSLWTRIPMIFTKCGGPAPGRYFPWHGDLIVYSREDVAWFSGNPKYADTRIHHLPNRLAPFDCDPALVDALRAQLETGVPILLRIARFCGHYEKSMAQGIALVKRLNAEGVACQFAIVGTVQDQESYARIAAQANEHVHFFTEPRFTADAKALLDAADLVIGTGRGFMEAASRSRILLTPLADGEIPLLVTRDAFESVFATNFSPRNRVDGYDEEANYARIKRALTDPDYRRELSDLAAQLNAENFDIYAALDRYDALYRDLRFRRRRPLLDLAHGAYKAVQSLHNARKHARIAERAKKAGARGEDA